MTQKSFVWEMIQGALQALIQLLYIASIFVGKGALSKISKLIVFDIKILRRKHLIGAIITMFESSSDVI